MAGLRQLTGTDRRGLGVAAASGRPHVTVASARDPKYTIVPQRQTSRRRR